MDGNTLRIVYKKEWSEDADNGTYTITLEFKSYNEAVPPSSWPEEECYLDDDYSDLDDYGDLSSLHKSRNGNNHLRKKDWKKESNW